MTSTYSVKTAPYQQVIGWAGVVLAALLASMIGVLAARDLGEGWPLFSEMLVLMALSLTALRWPRLGAALFVLAGVAIVGLFAAARLAADASLAGQGLQMAQVIGLFTLVGALFWRGRPARTRPVWIRPWPTRGVWRSQTICFDWPTPRF